VSRESAIMKYFREVPSVKGKVYSVDAVMPPVLDVVPMNVRFREYYKGIKTIQ
jgi:hypothetical protein